MADPDPKIDATRGGVMWLQQDGVMRRIDQCPIPASNTIRVPVDDGTIGQVAVSASSRLVSLEDGRY